jgi:hypothetical protein
MPAIRAAQAERRAKASVLELVRDRDDFLSAVIAEQPEITKAMALLHCTAMRASGADMLGFHGCGWWFCTAEADSVQWSELGKALGALQRAGIDQHGAQVAELGNACTLVRGWAPERDPYELLRESLIETRVKLPEASDAKRLCCKWIDEIRPLYKNAIKAKPRDNGRTDESRQAAFTLAKSWGWKAPTIAAVLVLTGAEMIDANRDARLCRGRDFKAVREEVTKAFERFVNPKKKPNK